MLLKQDFEPIKKKEKMQLSMIRMMDRAQTKTSIKEKSNDKGKNQMKSFRRHIKEASYEVKIQRSS